MTNNIHVRIVYLFICFSDSRLFRHVHVFFLDKTQVKVEEEKKEKKNEGALLKLQFMHTHTQTHKYIYIVMNRRMTNARTINEIIGRLFLS